MASSYDSSKDICIGIAGEEVIKGTKYRVAIYKYNGAAAKVAVESVIGFNDDGTERFVTVKGRLPIEVFTFVVGAYSAVSSILSGTKAPATAAASFVNPQIEEEEAPRKPKSNKLAFKVK